MATGVHPEDLKYLQADHIVPFSKGGVTDVTNCQLLTPRQNQIKGANYMELRNWQQEFIEVWNKKECDFLLVAVPGAGKTFAALTAAKTWIRNGINRKLAIVSPSDNLRTQWRTKAAQLGIELKTKELEFGVKDYDGYSTTYQALADSNGDSFLYLSSKYKWMVILDEVHHCGEEEKSKWGKAVSRIYQSADKRLLLSGTPWRSDYTSIPFVSYSTDGNVICDYDYEYRQAINDNVVRFLRFDYLAAKLEMDDGKILDLNKETEEAKAPYILNKVLKQHTSQGFLESLLRASHDCLSNLRTQDNKAAGLVVCRDQNHANNVAKKLKSITKRDPYLVISEKEDSSEILKRFSNSNAEWLVSVRMVSEGTDIPRLRVLTYATNYSTPLFFRQVCGRVSRVQGKFDQEAYVFLPADPRLIELAGSVESQQKLGLKDRIEHESQPKNKEQIEQFFDEWEPDYVSSHDAENDLVLLNNNEYDRMSANTIEKLAIKHDLTHSKVESVLRDWLRESGKNGAVELEEKTELSLEEKTKNARSKYVRICKSIASKIKKKKGGEYKEIIKDIYKKTRCFVFGENIQLGKLSLDQMNQLIEGTKQWEKQHR